MEIVRTHDGKFTATFLTSSGELGRVTLTAITPEEAADECETLSIDRLERAGQLVNLSHEIYTQIVAGRIITVSEALRLWNAAMSEGHVLADSTRRTNSILVSAWARDVGVSNKPLSAVVPKLIADYINNGSERRTTAERKLAAIRQFFGFCHSSGYLARNPASKELVRIRHTSFSHGELERCDKRPFNAGDIEKLLDHVRGEEFWEPAVQVGLHTGLRLGDAATLESQSLDDLGRLSVWTQKTGTRVQHLVTEPSLSMLRSRQQGQQYFFPEQAKMILETETGRNTLTQQFIRLCAKAGVPGKSFHLLRHTFATNEIAKGQDIASVSGSLGHRNTTTTELYIHPATG